MKHRFQSKTWHSALLALTMTVLAGATGCTWDSSKYDDFMIKGDFIKDETCLQELGNSKKCYPQLCDEQDGFVKLVKIGSCDIGQDDKCESMYKDSVKYNICPIDSPYCIPIYGKGYNEGDYQCARALPSSETLICDPGTHPNSTNTICENDDVDNCGGLGISCRQQGALTVYCVLDDGASQSKCVSSACDNHYHLKDGACVADSATECGSGLEDCTQNTSTGMTVCSNGRCDSRCSGNEQNCQGNCLIFANVHIDNCDNNVLKCQDGYIDLDEDVTNGCEINKAMVHIESYDAVNKKIECVSGFANWDNDLANGCETELSGIHVKYYDAVNDQITCIDNYADCDGMHYPANAEIEGVVQKMANGCEINLMNSNTHCGQCATVDEDAGTVTPICNSEHVCQDGICVRNNCLGESAETGTPDMCRAFIPELDGEGQPVYDGEGNPVGSYENQCFNVNANDPDRCGACDYKCSENPATHATSNTCEDGVCQYECESGYTNCSDSSTDVGINCISDAAMQQDSNNCGECGKVCGVNEHGERTVCVGGECVVNSCTNAEETPCQEDSGMVCHALNSDDANNCGGCGNICANNPTATAISNECKAGACQYTCKPEYTNCGTGVTTDSISCVLTTSMQYDNAHCGSCGTICGSDESCVAGKCEKNTCTEGMTFCGMSDCRDTKTNVDNCGACNNSCSTSAPANASATSCIEGVCQYGCLSTHQNCGDGTTANSIMCVSTASMQYDNYHCGNCDTICGSDESCVDGNCVKNTCDDGMTFCGMGDCRDTKSNLDNCGACNNACSSNAPANSTATSCAAGVCQYDCMNTHQNCGGTTANTIICVSKASMQYDNYHCGNCNTVCNSNESCVAGECKKNTCSEGLTFCGLDDCRDTKTDIDNCGACNNSCSASAPTSSTPTSCVNGVCQYGCPSTHQNCGGGTTANTIMCISTASMQYDNYHCGNCDTACGSDESCVAGKCEKNTCDEGLTFCGMGDCRDTKNRLTDCGACNNSCSSSAPANATATSCVNGACQYGCLSTHQNCGTGTAANTIMCVSTASMQYDNYHCGNCDTVCSSDESCVDGECKKNTCSEGLTFCGLDDCRETKISLTNCGACNNDCSTNAPANAIATSCVNGVCQYGCSSTHQNCGGGTTANTIMCVSTASMQYDNYHCGNCDTACSSDESCVAGQCVKNTCAGGLTFCGMGDCRDTKNKLTDCGACNNSCSSSAPANATATSCVNGACQYGCLSTHQNCGTGMSANTIMCVSTDSMQYDNYHCGSCTKTCNNDESCVAGNCVKNTCSVGLTFCGLDDCRDTKTSVTNCGACNNDCSTNAPANSMATSCSNGICQYGCQSTHQNCGRGTTANSIMCVSTVSMQYDNYHCGDCDTVCGSDESCVAGECKKNTCGEGLTFCGLDDCRNTKSELTDCGACNNSCSSSAPANATATSCENGACQYGCLSTHQNCGTGTSANTIMCVSTDSMQYDNYHCGSCTKACNSDESCVAGNCVKNTCGDGLTFCGLDDCRDTKASVTNCGSCNNDCSANAPANSTSTSCSNGVCQYGCQSTHQNCGGGTTANSIMCVSTASMQYDNYHCGNCETVCDSDESCVAGECKKNTCGEGLTFCGMDDCRDTKNSVENCGACNNDCSANAPANTVATSCVNGVCQYDCLNTHENCGGGTTANSIVCVSKDSMQYDNYHCGGCVGIEKPGKVCGSAESCISGTCVTTGCSNTNETLCTEASSTGNGTTNVCKNLRNNTENCGYCGYKCSEHLTGWDNNGSCVNGVCECQSGYHIEGSSCVQDCTKAECEGERIRVCLDGRLSAATACKSISPDIIRCRNTIDGASCARVGCESGYELIGDACVEKSCTTYNNVIVAHGSNGCSSSHTLSRCQLGVWENIENGHCVYGCNSTSETQVCNSVASCTSPNGDNGSKTCIADQPKICNNGTWENYGAVCQYGCRGNGECDECNANICDGNKINKCENGKFKGAEDCPVVANGTQTCVNGACKLTGCSGNYHLEGETCEPNCTTNVCTSGKIQYCNSDGRLSDAMDCPAIANGTTSCSGNSCALTGCNEGYYQEGNSCLKKCTVDVCSGDQIQDCDTVTGLLGSAHDCPTVENGTQTCVNGVCKVTSCSSDYYLDGTTCVKKCTANVCSSGLIQICDLTTGHLGGATQCNAGIVGAVAVCENAQSCKLECDTTSYHMSASGTTCVANCQETDHVCVNGKKRECDSSTHELGGFTDCWNNMDYVNLSVACNTSNTECASVKPCVSGYHLADGICVQDASIVCTTGTYHCNGNAIEVCNDTNSGFIPTSITCGNTSICNSSYDGTNAPCVCPENSVLNPSTLQCEAIISACVADKYSCADGVLKHCNALGTNFDSSSDCTSGVTNGIGTCSVSDGGTTGSCAVTCNDHFGTLEGKTCKCSENASYCDELEGERYTILKTCASDGLSYEQTSCSYDGALGETAGYCEVISETPDCRVDCADGYTQNDEKTECTEIIGYCTTSTCVDGVYKNCTGNSYQTPENCSHYNEVGYDNTKLCNSAGTACVSDYSNSCASGYAWNSNISPGACQQTCPENRCSGEQLILCDGDFISGTTPCSYGCFNNGCNCSGLDGTVQNGQSGCIDSTHYGTCNNNSWGEATNCTSCSAGNCQTGTDACTETTCVDNELTVCDTSVTPHTITSTSNCFESSAHVNPAMACNGNACKTTISEGMCDTGYHFVAGSGSEGGSCELNCSSANNSCNSETGEKTVCNESTHEWETSPCFDSTLHVNPAMACNGNTCKTTITDGMCADGYYYVDGTCSNLTCVEGCSADLTTLQLCNGNTPSTQPCTDGQICTMIGESAPQCVPASSTYCVYGTYHCDGQVLKSCNPTTGLYENTVTTCPDSTTEYTVTCNAETPSNPCVYACVDIALTYYPNPETGHNHCECSSTGNDCGSANSICDDNTLKICNICGYFSGETNCVTAFTNASGSCEQTVSSASCIIGNCDVGFSVSGETGCSCQDGDTICGGSSGEMIMTCASNGLSYEEGTDCSLQTALDSNAHMECQTGSNACVQICNDHFELSTVSGQCEPECSGEEVSCDATDTTGKSGKQCQSNEWQNFTCESGYCSESDAGRCVACRNTDSGDCTGGTVCNMIDHTCVECTSYIECVSVVGKPYCNSSHECSECPSGTHWDTTSHECESCPPTTPYWNGTICDECPSPLQWSSTSNTCVQVCSSDTDCTDSSTPICNLTLFECEACPSTAPLWNGIECEACPLHTHWNSTTLNCETDNVYNCNGVACAGSAIPHAVYYLCDISSTTEPSFCRVDTCDPGYHVDNVNNSCVENTSCDDDSQCITTKVCDKGGCVTPDSIVMPYCNTQSLNNNFGYGRVYLDGRSIDDYDGKLVCLDGSDNVVLNNSVSYNQMYDNNAEFMASYSSLESGSYKCIFVFKVSKSSNWYACSTGGDNVAITGPTNLTDVYDTWFWTLSVP